MKRLLILTAVVSAIGLTTQVQAQQQSLVDAAKQAEAARVSAGRPVTPARVTTGTDQSTPVVAADVVVADPVPPVVTKVAVSGARPEAYWRGRMGQLVAQLNADVLAADAAQRHYLAVRASYDAQFGPNPGNGIIVTSARIAAFEVEMHRLEAEAKPLTAAVRADHAAITALEEEARKAKVPPGWSR